MPEATYFTKAIVIKRQAFNESSGRVIVFTEKFGKQDLIARGLKKLDSKLAAHLEPLNFIDLMIVKGKHYDYVGSAINKKSFSNLKNDLDKITSAGEAFSLFNKLIKTNLVDQEVFNLLLNYLVVLDSVQSEGLYYYFLSRLFLFKLIILLGYCPAIEANSIKVENYIISKNLEANRILLIKKMIDFDLIKIIKEVKFNKADLTFFIEMTNRILKYY